MTTDAADDYGHSAAASGAANAAELIAREVNSEHGCWACISRTTQPAVDGRRFRRMIWLQEQLADALDQAATGGE